MAEVTLMDLIGYDGTTLDCYSTSTPTSTNSTTEPSPRHSILLDGELDVLAGTTAHQTLATDLTASLLTLTVPPPLPLKNFGLVTPLIYRSNFPTLSNIPHLTSLGLNSILTLVDTPYPLALTSFVASNGIKHFRICITANKDPLMVTSITQQCNMAAALGVLLDPRNHPLLVHCNKGKHRTGCVVACYRKTTGWSLDRTLKEYELYAGVKKRLLDAKFIEAWDERSVLGLARQHRLKLDESLLLPSREQLATSGVAEVANKEVQVLALTKEKVVF